MRVVVVGGGVIGASIGDALAVRGADVVMLDMRGAGRGASHASAGILAPFTEADRDSPLLALGTRSLAMFDAFAADVAARSGRSIEYARTGTLEVALDAGAAAHLAESVGWIRDAGMAATWIDGADLPAFEPAAPPHAAGALFMPAHGFVGVPQLVRALTLAARSSGAVIAAPVEVVSIEPGRDAVRVRAGDREWSADRVVVATGAWTSRVNVRGTRLPEVRPVRGQLLHLGWPAGVPPPQRVVWGPDCYTVPWSDRTLLVGATVEHVGFDERSTVEGVQSLLTAVRRLLPASADASLEGVRVGLRPASVDGLPYIGVLADAPAVVVAGGHFRNGILLAPLTADLTARLIVDGVADPALALTNPGRATP